MSMNDLSRETIFIGRESNQGRLLIALSGSSMTALIGSVGSVPGSVSRCKPAENTAHCKISVDQSGNMVIANMKPQNVTYVDGLQVESKKITEHSTIALGKDKYSVSVHLILEAARKLMPVAPTPSPSAQEYSIKHLEKIYKNYEDAMETIQRHQQKMGRRRMLPIMIGSASAVLSPLLGIYVGTATYYVTVPIAILSFVIYMYNYREKDTSIEDRKEANNTLIDHYVCPNPDCKRFMGNQPYRLLRQNKKCPFCGCKFTES